MDRGLSGSTYYMTKEEKSVDKAMKPEKESTIPDITDSEIDDVLESMPPADAKVAKVELQG